MQTERELEQATRNAVLAAFPEVLYLKLSVIAHSGYPDRMVLMPGARVVFLELKRKGQRPRALQTYVHNVLRKFGFRVEVVYGPDEAVAAIQAVMDTPPRPTTRA